MASFLPLDHVLPLRRIASVACSDSFSGGAIQQVSGHARKFQQLTRTAVAALRHLRQVKKPFLILQEIGRGLQNRCQVSGVGCQGVPRHRIPGTWDRN